MIGWLHKFIGRESIGDWRNRNAALAAKDNDVEGCSVASPLHEIFFAGPDHGLSHKWVHYLDIYHENFQRFRGTNARVLEIGVSQGGSLDMWRKYFGDGAVIFGVDIDPRCEQFNNVNAQVRIGSQDDPAFLDSVVDEMGGIDIVIDDGSHISRHVRASFDVLFDRISETGIYLCEDLHTAYWPGVFEGGYRRRSTFIEFAKQIVDDMHADFHDKRYTAVESANRKIKVVKFYNSIIVIEKAPQAEPRHVRMGTEVF